MLRETAPYTSTGQHRRAGSRRSSSGNKTEAARNTAAIYFPVMGFLSPLSRQLFLALKGNLWSKVSNKAVESFDSQWSESWFHKAVACTIGASCWADLPPRATPGHPSKGPPTRSAQPMVSPAPWCLGPKSPFSTGIAKANSRRYLLGVMLSITLI